MYNSFLNSTLENETYCFFVGRRKWRILFIEIILPLLCLTSRCYWMVCFWIFSRCGGFGGQYILCYVPAIKPCSVMQHNKQQKHICGLCVILFTLYYVEAKQFGELRLGRSWRIDNILANMVKLQARNKRKFSMWWFLFHNWRAHHF